MRDLKSYNKGVFNKQIKSPIPILVIFILLLPLFVDAQSNKEVVEFYDNGKPLRVNYLNDDLKLVKYNLFGPDGKVVAEFNYDPVSGKKHGAFYSGINKGSYNQNVLTADNYCYIDRFQKIYFSVLDGNIQGQAKKYTLERNQDPEKYRVPFEQIAFNDYSSISGDYSEEIYGTLNYNEQGKLDGRHDLNEEYTLFYDDGRAIGYIRWNGETDMFGNVIVRGALARDSIFYNTKLWKFDNRLLKNTGIIKGMVDVNYRTDLESYKIIKEGSDKSYINDDIYFQFGDKIEATASDLYPGFIDPTQRNEHNTESLQPSVSGLSNVIVEEEIRILDENGIWVYEKSQRFVDFKRDWGSRYRKDPNYVRLSSMSIEELRNSQPTTLHEALIIQQMLFNKNSFREESTAYYGMGNRDINRDRAHVHPYDFLEDNTWNAGPLYNDYTREFTLAVIKNQTEIDSLMTNKVQYQQWRDNFRGWSRKGTNADQYEMELISHKTLLRSSNKSLSKYIDFKDALRKIENDGLKKYKEELKEFIVKYRKLALFYNESCKNKNWRLAENTYNSIDSLSQSVEWKVGKPEPTLNVDIRIVKQELKKLELREQREAEEKARLLAKEKLIKEEWEKFDNYVLKMKIWDMTYPDPFKDTSIRKHAVSEVIFIQGLLGKERPTIILDPEKSKSSIDLLESQIARIIEGLPTKEISRTFEKEINNNSGSITISGIEVQFEYTEKPNQDFLYDSKTLKSYWKKEAIGLIYYSFGKNEIRFYPDYLDRSEVKVIHP